LVPILAQLLYLYKNVKEYKGYNTLDMLKEFVELPLVMHVSLSESPTQGQRDTFLGGPRIGEG